MRLVFLFSSMLLGLFLSCFSAEAAPAPVPTQRQWMTNLVGSLGLSFGLPDQPQDSDYLKILSGNRQFRFEAEEIHQPSDMVSVNSYISYGPFSGKGWLNGISQPTQAHFKFLLPLPGHYRFAAVVRLSDHVFSVAGQSFTVTGKPEQQFHRVSLGELTLPGGEQEITVEIPPNASIDYLELSASSLTAIRPRSGWLPDTPLTLDDMAITMAQALELESLLPLSGVELKFEAETTEGTPRIAMTDIRHLGQPSGGRWMRAGASPIDFSMVFTPPATGVYDLTVRAAAGRTMAGTLNENFAFAAEWPSYLADVGIGTFDLRAEENHIQFQVPSRGGIDVLLLKERSSAPADYLRIVGLPAASPLTADSINRLLSLLAALRTPG